MSLSVSGTLRVAASATVVAALCVSGGVRSLAAQSTHFHTLFGTVTPTTGPSVTCYPEANPLDPVNRPVCATVNGVSSLSVPGAVGTFEVNSGASQVLKARSTVTVTNGTAASYTAFARSGYVDVVSFSGGFFPAKIQFAVDIDGFHSSSDPRCPAINSACPYTVFNVRNFGAQTPAGVTGGLPSTALVARGEAPDLSGFITVDVLGEVNTLRFLLSAVSFISRPQDVAAGDPWSGSASADFFNTAYLRSVSFLDANGADVTDQVQATWSSGLTYADVPEPSTFALCGMGLVGLFAVARRRRL